MRIWLALSLVEVKPIDPSDAKDAVNPMPAEESAKLKASIELTLPAATVLLTVIVVAAPAAGVKTKVLPLSELAPALVRSPTVPATTGAVVVADAFDRITGGRLQHLVGDRLCGIDQLLQRGETGVGSLQDLHAVADAVQQIVDVAGAVVEALRGEEVGRIVERRIDFVASRKAVLSGRQ